MILQKPWILLHFPPISWIFQFFSVYKCVSQSLLTRLRKSQNTSLFVLKSSNLNFLCLYFNYTLWSPVSQLKKSNVSRSQYKTLVSSSRRIAFTIHNPFFSIPDPSIWRVFVFFSLLRPSKTGSTKYSTRAEPTGYAHIFFTLQISCILKSSSKPWWQWQRECHQTKDFMSKTMPAHVRCKSLFIFLPSSAQQQRKMTKLCVFWRTRKTTANFSKLHFAVNTGVRYLAKASSALARSRQLQNSN